MIEPQYFFYVFRLISEDKSIEAVQIIREISVNRRCVKQDSLLLAYAILARCNDKATKRAAYAILSEVCRIPTHLFIFINYCELESREDCASKPSKHPGWGRVHKRAVSSWYTSFAKQPEQLARLVTKYRKHGEWSHKDVIKLAHTSTDDKAIGFILRYITKGLVKAREMYLDNVTDVDTDTRTTIDRIANLFQICDTARRCAKRQHLCTIITENKLSWEQCNSDLLRSKEVWSALLPHMPVEATIQNIGRMTSYGMFADNTEDEELVLNKIRSINILAETSMGTINYGGDGKVVKTEASYENTKERRNNILHPFSILLALDTYKKGRGDIGSLSWIPNQKIVQALDRAFYQAFETVAPTGKKFYLAVDVSASMSQPVLGCTDLSCSTAAAAMMMFTARTEENHIIKGFSENMVDIDVHEADTVWDVQKKMKAIPSGRSDCSQMMIDAMANRIKDVDVFVVYTDNETSLGKVHPCDALCKYRLYSERPNAKLIVCGMCCTQFTIADKDDPNMLDIVGFDPAAPRLIAEFAMDKI
ncbi:RNA-binding protein RO60-like [Mercenaria mercenaria]|uniref:RNA-binding protein RO60-like n=1 Tax=Mercenaria mercenaria TaxID=6596 RepID=UPI00234F8043|nr:RNA-binding protein RO60-like [Mercenaria mercenaria]